MDVRTFAEMEEAMRNSQKAYFKDRKPSDLQTSKSYEKMVDNAINQIIHPDKIKSQTNLF